MYFSQRLANLEIHLHGQFGLLLSDIELIVNKLNNRRYVTTAGGHALDIHHSHVVDSKQGVASFRGVGTELAFEDIKFVQCLSTKADTIFKMANSLAKVRADDKNRKVMASLETAVAFSCLSQVANIECKVCFCFIIFSLSRNYLKIKKLILQLLAQQLTTLSISKLLTLHFDFAMNILKLIYLYPTANYSVYMTVSLLGNVRGHQQ